MTKAITAALIMALSACYTGPDEAQQIDYAEPSILAELDMDQETVIFGDTPAYVDAYLASVEALGISDECVDAVMDHPVKRVSWDSAEGKGAKGYIEGNHIWVKEPSEHVSIAWHLAIAVHEAAHAAYWCMGIADGSVHHDKIEAANLTGTWGPVITYIMDR